MDFEENLSEPVSRIEVLPLGAGRDIGRSCVVLKFFIASQPLVPSSTVVFDCGLHVGHEDPAQAFPDFSQIDDINHIDAFLITHIHIDHCGALPQLTERHKYTGKIFMSPPTKALLPRMLEDQLRSRGFSAREVQSSVAKCLEMDLRRTYELKPGLLVKSFRAGHVLGAVMFLVSYRGTSVLYTGDYNATPDRHLGAFEHIGMDKVNVLITESTYGTTTRGSALSSEREFLDQVSKSLGKGGKVLIPTYALGRVPEMISLLESHWQRMNFKFKILLCTREAVGVNKVYKQYESWGQSRQRPASQEENSYCEDAATRDSFSSCVLVRDPTEQELTGNEPLVLIATSAMLAGGLSLRAFRLWAKHERNAVIFPGACVRGTLGFRLLNLTIPGQLDKVDVNCSVSIAPFNAHTDSKGILQLVHQTRPDLQCVLVHGVQVQMEALKRRIEREVKGTVVSFPENLTPLVLPVPVVRKRLKSVHVVETTFSKPSRLACTTMDEFQRALLAEVRSTLDDELEITSNWEGITFAKDEVMLVLKFDPQSQQVTGFQYRRHGTAKSSQSTTTSWIQRVWDLV